MLKVGDREELRRTSGFLAWEEGVSLSPEEGKKKQVEKQT